jgi:hypothetical protein
MHTFENKNMWVTIEEAMDSKDLISNATSQNKAIKVGMRIFVKNIHEGLSSETKKFCPCYAPLLHLSPL